MRPSGGTEYAVLSKAFLQTFNIRHQVLSVPQAPAGSSSWGPSWRPQPLYDSSSGPGIPRTFCARSRSCPYWSLLSCLDSTSSFPPPTLTTPSLVWTLFFIPIALHHCRSPQGHRIPRVWHFPPVFGTVPDTQYMLRKYLSSK